MQPPTIHDVYRARRRLDGHLTATPLLSYPALDAAVGASVWIKHENLQPTGAFKVRGGINLLAGMSESERARGILGYSTGNHAQSLAYAARAFGVRCTIVMPTGANPVKVQAVRSLGAELVEYGANFDEAKPYAEKLAADQGSRLVSAANEPALIAGVATAYLEILAAQPDLDAVIVPLGGGSGAAAACLVAAAVNPACEVIAVQSSQSPAGYDSWRGGECVTRPNRTIVEGLATGAGFALTQQMLREALTDFVLVDDSEIIAAQWLLMRSARTLTESAGAAALAALWARRDQLAGRRVAIVCSGGNASEAELRSCLAI